jgi:4-hydroxybenzoate polyprenyltransferase
MRALVALLRLHLVPTAWADVLAGAFLAGLPASPALAGVLTVSSALYLFGMVTNALADVTRDARLYPDRPLPAGRITLRQARATAAALLGVALAGSIWVPPGARAAAAGLLVLILAYNLGGKRIPLAGPILMGSCRALNLLMGAWTVAPRADAAALPAVLLGGYVACLTLLSTWEGTAVPLSRLRVSVLILLLFPAGLALLVRGAAWIPLGCLALLIAASYPHRAHRAERPEEGLVHRLLAGIYLLDASLLAQAGMMALCGLFTALGLWGLRPRRYHGQV